ncbi:MAG: ferredoxin family protein [Spirochaetaceae bacterium]
MAAKRTVVELRIDPAWCKRCGICVHFCPRGVLVADEQNLPHVESLDRCTGCRLCEYWCPDLAIEVRTDE